jgi:hypothetical protein
MAGITKWHKSATLFQVTVIIASLVVSSLGAVIEHPVTTYAWYLAMAAVASVFLTSLVMAGILLFSLVKQARCLNDRSKPDFKWLSCRDCAIVCYSVVVLQNVSPVAVGGYQKKVAF